MKFNYLSIICIVLLLTLSACGTGNIVQSGDNSNTNETRDKGKSWDDYEIVIPMADFLIPENFEEIHKNSDAIVIAKTQEEITDREVSVNYLEDGHIDTFYTDTDIEIIDIFDQSSESTISIGDTIKLRENFVLMQDEEKEYILIYDNYTPLKKGSEYILVLTQGGVETDIYYNEAWNLSKFNIDGTDPFDFLHDPYEQITLMSDDVDKINQEKVAETFNEFSQKKDGNSAYSLNALYSDKIEFFKDLKESFPEKFSE